MFIIYWRLHTKELSLNNNIETLQIRNQRMYLGWKLEETSKHWEKGFETFFFFQKKQQGEVLNHL